MDKLSWIRTTQDDMIKIQKSNGKYSSEYIKDLRNSSAKINNTNGEIYDFYYFYTFSTLGVGNIFDSSLKNNTNNNSILNINSDILIKNIFIDCEVNNNKIINSENIILYKSKFCNNVINNCTYEYSDFNIFNMLIYYGAITGSTAGGFDMPWGRDAVGKVNVEDNIINNSSNIQFFPNEALVNLGSLMPYNITNNKLYDYNNLQFVDTLNSAILFDYIEENIKKISDKENTVIDVPNITTYKNTEGDILNVSHDNINVNSFKNTNISSDNDTNIFSGNDTNITSINYTNISSDNDTFITSIINDTNISSGNKSKILANKYVFLQGNENISSDKGTKSSNNTRTSNSNTIYFDKKQKLTDKNINIKNLSYTNETFIKNRGNLQFLYDFENNNYNAGKTCIGVGNPLVKVKNNNSLLNNLNNIPIENYVSWTNNNNIEQYSLYYNSKTNLVKPTGFPKKLSYPKSIFATFTVNNENIDKSDIPDIDNAYLGKYLSTTIKSIESIAFTEDKPAGKTDKEINKIINTLIDIYPAFWFPIMGWVKNPNFDVKFIFNCKYYLTYDIEYVSEGNGSGMASGEFDILEGINYNNTDNSIKPDRGGYFFSILCVNSLKFINEDQKDTLKENITNALTEINKKIKSCIGDNYNESKERYVNTVKLGVKVTFEDIGGAAVLSSSKCDWFNIPYLNIIDSKYVKPIPETSNITTKNDKCTAIYKCMWNIPFVAKDYPNIQYNEQMDDSITHIFQNLPGNEKDHQWNRLKDASNKENEFDEETISNISNIFTVKQENKYQRIPITSEAEYDETNGVYVQLYNDATVLSVKQTFKPENSENTETPENLKNLKYINLGFDKDGLPIIAFNKFDANNKETPLTIKLTDIYNLLNP
jgi:hypothetical protein